MYAEKNSTEEGIPIRTIYIPNISINVSKFILPIFQSQSDTRHTLMEMQYHSQPDVIFTVIFAMVVEQQLHFV